MVKRISGETPISQTRAAEVKAREISKTSGVSSVSNVNSVTQVSNTGSGPARRKTTRIMSAEERAALFAMIKDETERLMNEGRLPEGKKTIVEGAVKMAIETGMNEEDTDE